MAERHLSNELAAAALVHSLAARLYEAHESWMREFDPMHSPRPEWWALDPDLKGPYIDAAKRLIEREQEADGG